MTVRRKVSFHDLEDIAPPGEDGQSLRLRFTIAPSLAEGAAEDAEASSHHELIVRLSGSQATAWGLDSQRGRAVMIHAAIAHVFESVRHGEPGSSEELVIDASTFPGAMPDKFDRPINVSGSTLEVERVS